MQEIERILLLIWSHYFKAERAECDRVRKLQFGDLTNCLDQTALHVNCSLYSLFVLLLLEPSTIPLVVEVHLC